MHSFRTILVLVAAFLAVFWAAAFDLPRRILGAQIDLLPPLMVYASLWAGFEATCLLALFGGLWFDSLSANPLGISVLPLFLVGLALHWKRELILKDQAFAQFVLGLAVSAATPTLTLVLLLTKGHSPVLVWGTLWQFLVMAIGGAIATPVILLIFEWFQRALTHGAPAQTSFRPDREIRRGR